MARSSWVPQRDAQPDPYDMAGPSTDVCLVGIEPLLGRVTSLRELPINTPDGHHTVGGGGGNISWIYLDGALNSGTAQRRRPCRGRPATQSRTR